MTEIAFAPPIAVETAADTVVERVERVETQRRARMRLRTAAVWATRIATAVVFLSAWEWAADRGKIDTLFFSSPSLVWEFLRASFAEGTIWPHLEVTIRETVIGFGVGSAAGVLAGLIRSQYRFLSDVSGPYLTILNALPRIALAPMFIIWFGTGEAPKVALAISLVFFILMVSTESGIASVDQELVVTMRALGAGRLQIFRKVLLRGAIPSIFGGLRLAVVYALLGVVVGEMLASRLGLGQQIQANANTFRTAGVIGTIAVLALIALALSGLVGLAERWMLRWRREEAH